MSRLTPLSVVDSLQPLGGRALIEIAACFNSGPGEFDPIFWEGREARSLRRIRQAGSSMQWRCVQRRRSRSLKVTVQAF